MDGKGWLSVQAFSFEYRKGSPALVSPAHVCRGRRARGAGRPFVAEKKTTSLADLGFTEGLCESVSSRRGFLGRFRALCKTQSQLFILQCAG